jgi:phospholipid transport system substrate-binding protein
MKVLRYLPLALGLLLAGTLGAAGDPAAKLRRTVDAALEAIYGECCADLGAEEKRARVRAAVEENFSLEHIIRRAIGRNWQKMTEAEREQVVELIARLVVKSYVNSLDGKERPEVSFGETVEISDKRIEVPSTVVADGETYSILYRLGRMRSGWEIYDIVAEGISVVSNYRQQFDEHFRGGDAAGLIARLEELLEKEDMGDEVKI